MRGYRFVWPWLALVLLVLLNPSAADESRDAYENRRKPGRCLCHQGKGTWEYLRSPLARPGDDPRCGLLIKGGDCGNRPRPPGTSGACWSSGKHDCFWRRHAYSWGIQCSECLKEGVCDVCDEPPRGAGPLRPRHAEGTHRVREEVDGRSGRRRDLPALLRRHELQKKVKLVTYRGTKRLMTAHEVAHLYAQRCEQAYDDFVYWFGAPIVMPKPMAVYVVDRKKEALRIGGRYFGDPETEMNYAFNYGDRIAEGFSGNGFVVELRGSARRTGHARIRPAHGGAHPLLLLAPDERLRGPVPPMGVGGSCALPHQAPRRAPGLRDLLRRRDKRRRGAAQEVGEARAGHGAEAHAADRDVLRAILALVARLPGSSPGLVDHGPHAP